MLTSILVLHVILELHVEMWGLTRWRVKVNLTRVSDLQCMYASHVDVGNMELENLPGRF